MMNVYRRYFKVEEGRLFNAVVEARAINDEAYREYAKILSEIGAVSTRFCLDKGKICGFLFERVPNMGLFKAVRVGGDWAWWPRSKPKEGKALIKRLTEIPTRNESLCIEEAGLKGNVPFLFGTFGVLPYPKMIVIPTEPIAVFVTVPWYDVDPALIEGYKKSYGKGGGIRNFDSLMWKPIEGMVEIEKAEMMKVIDKWNSSLQENG